MFDVHIHWQAAGCAVHILSFQGLAGSSFDLLLLIDNNFSSYSKLIIPLFLMQGSCCVWVGNGFAPATRVAFRGSLDLSPWLYVIPLDLAPFKSLFLQLGAQQSFSAQQYISVLQDMAAQAKGQQALSPAVLSQALAVSQSLADIPFPANASFAIPDAAGTLTTVVDMAYNDAPWLGALPNVRCGLIFGVLCFCVVIAVNVIRFKFHTKTQALSVHKWIACAIHVSNATVVSEH